MDAGKPDAHSIHPPKKPLQHFVELFATEGYVSRALRKLGLSGAAYAFGPKLAKPATAILHCDHPSNMFAEEVTNSIHQATIIFGNIPVNASKDLLRDLLRLVANNIVHIKILLLFRVNSDNYTIAKDALPSLSPCCILVGPSDAPFFRRSALFGNIDPQLNMTLPMNPHTNAGDGMPQKWAERCAAVLAPDFAKHDAAVHHLKMTIRGQPTHKRARLLSEYQTVMTMPLQKPLNTRDCVQLPQGKARVLDIGGQSAQDNNDKGYDDDDLCKDLLAGNFADSHRPSWFKAGIWRTPEEFMDAAKELQHPFDDIRNLPDELLEAYHHKLVHGAKEVQMERIGILKWIRELRDELQVQESQLKESMHPRVRGVVKNRQITLIEKLLKHTGFVDMQPVVDALKHGVNIVESVPFSPAFPPRYDPPQMTVDQLMEGAATFIDNLESRTKSYGTPELDQGLEEKVEKDILNAWAYGPFSRQQVSEFLGISKWIPSRRFPVVQAGGTKIRAIDDYTESGWNFCIGVRNRWTQHTLDELAVLGTSLPRLLHDGWVEVHLNDGRLLSAPVSSDCADGTPAELGWQGCTVDLDSAFRQLPIHPDAACASPLCYFSHKHQAPMYLCLSALPFGSVASVAWFLRYARALWFLGCKLLKLTWLSFFDDFIVLELTRLKGTSLRIILLFFRLLGVPVAVDKLCDLDFEFVALGVEVHMLGGPLGQIQLTNKAGRVQETIDAIRLALMSGRFSTADVQKARGRLGFISGFVSSKIAMFAVAKIRILGGMPMSSSLSSSSRHALEWLLERLPHMKPKVLGISSMPPVLLFSDASDENWGIGGVLVDPWLNLKLFFADHVPQNVVQVWRSKGAEEIIAQAEAFAALTCFATWGDRLQHRRVIHFFDNVAAESAFVSLSSRSPAMEDCVRVLARYLDETDALVWFCRCPSASNPADGPSRKTSSSPSAWQHDAVETSAVLPEVDMFTKAVKPKLSL